MSSNRNTFIRSLHDLGVAAWFGGSLMGAVALNGASKDVSNPLERAKIAYRTSYESPSLMGLFSMVEAGLAIAPLARCAVPSHFAQLGRTHGLPVLPELEIVLARSARSNRPPCDFLAEQILTELRL